jgi:phage terminase small subunit
MTTAPTKQPRGKRRELAPLEPLDAEDGPAMKALPTDRHRAFVRALYQVKPGHGAGVKAAKLAGWGQPLSSAASMATIGSRLMHDERILAAIFEEDQKRIRASAPRAISALTALVENPKHKDHARGIAMVLDRVHPAETVSTVKVQHDATPAFKDTAEVMARIAALAAKFSVKLPPVIDAEVVETNPRAIQ